MPPRGVRRDGAGVLDPPAAWAGRRSARDGSGILDPPRGREEDLPGAVAQGLDLGDLDDQAARVLGEGGARGGVVGDEGERLLEFDEGGLEGGGALLVEAGEAAGLVGALGLGVGGELAVGEGELIPGAVDRGGSGGAALVASEVATELRSSIAPPRGHLAGRSAATARAGS